jgi:hypothetical protein
MDERGRFVAAVVVMGFVVAVALIYIILDSKCESRRGRSPQSRPENPTVSHVSMRLTVDT